MDPVQDLTFFSGFPYPICECFMYGDYSIGKSQYMCHAFPRLDINNNPLKSNAYQILRLQKVPRSNGHVFNFYTIMCNLYKELVVGYCMNL